MPWITNLENLLQRKISLLKSILATISSSVTGFPNLLSTASSTSLQSSSERRCCYQARAVGHNALNQTVKKLCEKVGASGYFTNHSLRRTCASSGLYTIVD